MITEDEEGAASFIADMFAENRVALLEVTKKGTGQRTLLLCFHNHKDSKKGVDLVPFGEMFQSGFKPSEIFNTPEGSDMVTDGTKQFFDGIDNDKLKDSKDLLSKLD